MDGASILLVVAALGVSFGWQPDQEDPRTYEVTAQIEPELLDVLRSGREVPIEAHVPAEVTPIRRVRIVVGNSTLSRQTIAASEPSKPADRVVRGQEPAPQKHTANYENDPWSTSGTATDTSRQFDQRGATIGIEDIRTAQAPSPWARAQNAATETGSVLRDGVEAGIQQANDGFTRASNSISNSANDVGRSINQQYQNFTGNTGQAPAASWPAPPPGAVSTTPTAAPPMSPPTLSAPQNRSVAPPPSVATSSTSWSNIRPELAPPRFLNPRMDAASRPTATLASQPAPPMHSVLVDPNASSTGNSNRSLPPPPLANSGDSNWETGWGSTPTAATTPLPRTSQPAPINTTPIKDPAEEARWAWPAPTAAAAAPPTTPDRYSATPATPASAPKDIWADFPPVQPAATPAPATTTDRYAAPPAANPAPVTPAIGTAPTAVVNASPTASPAEQVPWIPLLVTSVSLAGSLGANLFLGWSYADARHRYRNLVRKTTNSFHRATGVAA